MKKDLVYADVEPMVEEAKNAGCTITELISIIEQLSYIARDNGYDDDLTEQILSILEG